MKRMVHVDLDAFFASVEELRTPALRGKPVMVGADKRGVVCSCNYLARQYGIHAGMSVMEARRRCPQGVFVSGKGSEYGRASRHVFAILERFTPLVEQAGIDEGYMDLAGTSLMHKCSYPEVVERMREAVLAETGLVISCGLGTTKVFSKIAGKLAKPNGFFTVLPSREVEVLHGLPVGMLPGVGAATAAVMNRYRCRTIGDFARWDMEVVGKRLGTMGLALYHLAWNRDYRGIELGKEPPKSMSKEYTLPRDTRNGVYVEEVLQSLLGEVCQRLRSKGMVGRVLEIKVKNHRHCVRQRSMTLSHGVQGETELWDVLRSGLYDVWDGESALRQVGVGLSGLTPVGWLQGSMWMGSAMDRVLHTADTLRQRFGKKVLGVGYRPRPVDPALPCAFQQSLGWF